MSFSLPFWLLFPVLAIGMWLAYRLYFGSTIVSRRWRWTLGALTILAWFVIAGLLVQPLWTHVFAVYHAPAIVLAVDESPSYSGGATLHSAAALRKNVEEVRAHYEQKGFKVFEFAFGETVLPVDPKNEKDNGQKIDRKINVGTRTSLETLRHVLDSLELPNLQGVFLWTDGRSNKDLENELQAWPAAVFPVSLQGGTSGEVQGEKVEADFSNPDSGVEVTAEWRAVGKSGHGAMLEFHSGSQTLWKEALPNAGASVGMKLQHRFRIPASLLRGKEDRLTALVLPSVKADNETEKNDTVVPSFPGLHRERQIFLRPLRSLEERGLVDALFASDSMEVRVVPSDALETNLRDGAVLWTHARMPQLVSAAKKTATPWVVYSLADDPISGKAFSFTSAARVTWREDAGRFFPGEVLSLADLGVSSWQLPEVKASSEVIAWAEEGNHRGALLSWDGNAVAPQFQFRVPPVWSTEFHPAGEERVRGLQLRWVQGAAEWMRHQGSHAHASAPVAARDPMDIEMSRLGVDEEKLSSLAMITHGSLLHFSEGDATFITSLPDLPRGQSEEMNSKARPLFPFLIASWIVAGLLCAVWAARKKLHLD